MNTWDYGKYESISKFIQSKVKTKPILGIICGSGLGNLSDQLQEQEVLNYSSIPDFPVSSVQGHVGAFIFGKLSGVATVCMKGRFHAYEGHEMWKCAMPVRIMKLLGINTLIVTNAAGGINPDFKVGDIMIINDQICLPKLITDCPLRGPNDERWGPRFLALNNMYNREMAATTRKIAAQIGLSNILREGVYLMQGGPSYETPAEIRLCRILGADAVGMSTGHEVIFAHHCGLRIFGLSMITNECISDPNSTGAPNHEEVLATAKRRAKEIETLVTLLVKETFKPVQ